MGCPNNSSNSSTPRNPNAPANFVCNNCGHTGHYARQCTFPPRAPTANRGQRPPSQNENASPQNQQQHRAYYIADTGSPERTSVIREQAFSASSLDPTHNDPSISMIWPNSDLPQMEINQPLLDRDFPPSTQYQPPNTDAVEMYPDDQNSPHQRFGPFHLCNWLPDSGATSHYTPGFSELRDATPCKVPISLADGSTKMSTYKGTSE